MKANDGGVAESKKRNAVKVGVLQHIQKQKNPPKSILRKKKNFLNDPSLQGDTLVKRGAWHVAAAENYAPRKQKKG